MVEAFTRRKMLSARPLSHTHRRSRHHHLNDAGRCRFGVRRPCHPVDLALNFSPIISIGEPTEQLLGLYLNLARQGRHVRPKLKTPHYHLCLESIGQPPPMRNRRRLQRERQQFRSTKTSIRTLGRRHRTLHPQQMRACKMQPQDTQTRLDQLGNCSAVGV